MKKGNWKGLPKRTADDKLFNGYISANAPESPKKMQTLAAFINERGSSMASVMIGVSTVTLWRWRKRKTSPRGNDAKRLRELGVTVS